MLFACLDSTTIGSTFVKLPGNRLAPLFRLLGILEILRRDRDQAIALIILLNDNLGAGLTLQRLDHLATRTDHSTDRSEEHTSELQSRGHLVCRLLLEKKNIRNRVVLPMPSMP